MVPAVPADTPTQRLAETLLGEDLDEWIMARRARGLSWRSIAVDLAVTTKGAVDVNRETMRVWYRPERELVEAERDEEIDDDDDELVMVIDDVEESA